MRIRFAAPDEFPQVRDFYRRHATGRDAAPEDRFLLAEDEGVIVGAVRLREEEGHLLLRTMQVADAYQRQGLGKRMLDALSPEIGDRPCLCLAHGYLDGFYGRIGFMRVRSAEMPPHLQARLARYREQRPHMIAMRRGA